VSPCSTVILHVLCWTGSCVFSERSIVDFRFISRILIFYLASLVIFKVLEFYLISVLSQEFLYFIWLRLLSLKFLNFI
jgi:hypothetical protein